MASQCQWRGFASASEPTTITTATFAATLAISPRYDLVEAPSQRGDHAVHR